ncbi:hypothetical protein OF83DRAFT_1064159, partial [Amylostereum chailletii]
KLDYSSLPFLSGRADSALSDNCRLTVKLKANYLQHLDEIKTIVISMPECPDFPQSGWKAVLSDTYFDLDVVFSSLYAIGGDGRDIQKLGEYELHGGPSKPAKHIATSGEWGMAFERYQDAVTFVYPHRRDELAAYRRHIINYFGAVHGHDDLVLNYDRAVRARVGRSNALELSDTKEFTALETMHITAGLASRPATSNISRARGSTATGARRSQGPQQSTEICRRFNAGNCSGKGCKYRHACSSCGGKHGAHECGRGDGSAHTNH